MDNTEPPCLACVGHEELEKDFTKMKDSNRKEHTSIIEKVDRLIGDVKWIKVIGSWILIAMLSYFVAIAVYLFNIHPVTQIEVHNLEKAVKEGETKHFENELIIEHINTKLDVLIKLKG